MRNNAFFLPGKKFFSRTPEDLFRPLLISVVFFFSLAVPAEALRTTKTLLDNGLTVLVTEMPESPTTAVDVLVKAGSATEGKFLGRGISHFLEHMVFKGTPTRGVGEIAAKIQAVGGHINASTGADHTLFTVTVPNDAFGTALEVLSDMLANPLLDPEETARERDVILNEIRLYNDNPSRVMTKITSQNVYREHPYRHPVIGYPELFQQITRNDLSEYLKGKYVPANMILSVAGNVKTDDALERIKKAFQDFPAGPPVTRDLIQEPQQISPRYAEQYYPTDLAQLTMSYSGVRLLDRDMYRLDVLAKILGQSGSSRLYNVLYRDLKLVYGISSSNYTPVDRGVFEIRANLENKNVESAVAAIRDVVEAVRRDGVTGRELDIAKKSVIREHVFSLQTASSAAERAAYDEAMGYDENFSEKYVDAVRKVTKNDVREAARKYLVPDGLSVTVLRPLKDRPVSSPEAQILEATSAQMTILPNGGRVIVKEDRRLPIVNVRIVWNGGVREEPQDLTGLSELMASLLNRGTKKYTAKEMAALVDAEGIEISTFSGQNSVGLTVDCLAEDLPKVWPLIDEIVHIPVFDERELETLKNDMRSSVRRRRDSISETTQLSLKELLFKGHPLQFDPGGSLETIDRLTRPDVIALYRRLIVPNRMVVAVYGDVAGGDVLDKIKDVFGRDPRHEFAVSGSDLAPLPPSCERTVRMDKEQAMVMIGFRGLSLFDADRQALEVMTELLTSSFDGRFFRAVREKEGKAYTVGGYFIPNLDTGFVYFFALTAPQQAEDVAATLKTEIEKLKSGGVSEEELKNVKTFMKGRHTLFMETNDQKAFSAALNELYGLGYRYDDGYDADIDRVTAEDISRVAGKILDWARSCQVVTLPEKDILQEPLPTQDREE